MLKEELVGKKTGLPEQGAFTETPDKRETERRSRQLRRSTSVSLGHVENNYKAKAQVELNLATAVKDIKKWFCMYINNKRQNEKKLHHLLNMGGKIVTKDEEKAT